VLTNSSSVQDTKASLNSLQVCLWVGYLRRSRRKIVAAPPLLQSTLYQETDSTHTLNSFPSQCNKCQA